MTWTAVVLLVAVLASGGVLAGLRINQPLHDPTVHARLSASQTVMGPAPSLPWPAKGQGAVSIPTLGYTDQSGPESPVPIASLTKLTTAVVVLHDHPVPANSDGPAITISSEDAAEYGAELHLDESTLEIQAGEVVSERQLLEGLLLASANDVAYALAAWDAGTQSAFVDKMNALAAYLGATSTRFVDVSGYDPASRSTAADTLRIAAAGMRDPTFAAVVAMQSAAFPLVGTVHNVVSEVGNNGVVGIKSGYTSQAGGCLVLAGQKLIQGRSVTVLVAVLGQPTPPPVPTSTSTTSTTAPPPPPGPTTTTTLPPGEFVVPDPFRYTRPVAESLLAATENGVEAVPVVSVRTVVGSASTSWGGTTYRVGVRTAHSAWLLAWPGQRVASATEVHSVAPGSAEGSRVGSALYALGDQIQEVPLELAATVPEPSWWWRLAHHV